VVRRARGGGASSGHSGYQSILQRAENVAKGTGRQHVRYRTRVRCAT
jgi:hypothetical protein